MAVYKEVEFKAFLKLIENGQAGHWVQVAAALGVDKNTITAWKKLPEAKQAIAKGISYSLERMQAVGRNDWRMWSAKLKMLGLNDEVANGLTAATRPVDAILKMYGLDYIKNDEIDL